MSSVPRRQGPPVMLQPQPTDVFIGKGCRHVGNMWLLDLVEQNFEEYEAADEKSDFLDKGIKRSKDDIKKDLVDAVTARGGRFLVKINGRAGGGGGWMEASEARALKRVTEMFKGVRTERKKLLDELVVGEKEFLRGISFPNNEVPAEMDLSVSNNRDENDLSVNVPMPMPMDFCSESTWSQAPSEMDHSASEFGEGVSAVASMGRSDISSLTSLTSHNTQTKGRRLRGGNTAVEKATQPFWMPSNTWIRTSGRLSVDDDPSALTMGVDMDACKRLLLRIKNEPDNALLQIRCFGELAEIACWKQIPDDTCNEIADGLPTLVGIMARHRTNTQVQGHCCMAFGWLASNNETLKRFIALHGGVKAIVRAMKEHKDDEMTQANGCLALGNLAANDDSNKQKIAEEGGIEIVVRAMRHNVSSADVQRYGCGAITLIATKSTSNTLSVANADGIEAIVKAMQIHVDIEKVQINGSWALGTLSSHITSVKASVAGIDGIGTILGGMSHHPESEEVQTSGCVSLLHLTLEKHLDDFTDAKGAEIILAAMNYFRSNETLQLHGCVLVGKITQANMEAQEDFTVAQAITTMLRVSVETWTDLNVNNEARTGLGRLARNNSTAQKRIAQAVVGTMMTARHNSDVQANCCCTLEMIAKLDSDARHWIVAAGGPELVRMARATHPKIDDVAKMALASLTDDEVLEEETSDAIDGISSVISEMYQHADEGGKPRKREKIQEKSLRLLFQMLSSNTNVGHKFIDSEVLSVLIMSMTVFPGNVRIQGTCFALLYMLLVCNHECRSTFLRRGGARVLVNAMANWQTCEAVQCYGCKTLKLMAAESCHYSRRCIFEAKALPVLHTAKALFPRNAALTKAANNTISLLAMETGRETDTPVRESLRVVPTGVQGSGDFWGQI